MDFPNISSFIQPFCLLHPPFSEQKSSQLVDIALKKQNVAEFYLNQGDGATALILFKEAKDQWAKVDFVPGESSGWWIEANIERCETVIDELERELDNYLPKGI